MTGRETFQVVWKFKNDSGRRKHRRLAQNAVYARECPALVEAYDQILWEADREEMADRVSGCRAARPSRRGGELRPVGAALALMLLASQPQGTDASSLCMASILAVPV